MKSAQHPVVREMRLQWRVNALEKLIDKLPGLFLLGLFLYFLATAR